MSTRGAIARLTRDDGLGWEGRYHHWDAYPQGLGSTLFKLHRDTFGGRTKTMLAELIDAHPAGWSTINGADWAQAPGYHNDQNDPCGTCGREHWTHYIQNYKGRGKRTPKPFKPGTYARYDHGYQPMHLPTGPQCFCHGTGGEKGWLVTNLNAAGSGVEYAYVFDVERRHMLILSSYTDQGEKMIGMFGSGEPEARWSLLADVDLDGAEPNWEYIERAA